MRSISRRKFIRTSAASAVVLFAGCSSPRKNQAADAEGYPSVKIGNINSLNPNEPLSFNYPDDKSPCIAVKLTKEAIGGIGPKKNVVAFSTLCTHMGCPATYNNGRLVCKCHYSMFDVSLNGQTYQGLASQWIAQIVLRLDTPTGDIYAEGVEGLIYGRIGNLKLS
uniref:Arsenite oxidase, small subunit n=1 Tax=Chlorobium phaeobacteroides (strain BS1) TaxID=331678 RepID=B3EPM5_CHLPB